MAGTILENLSNRKLFVVIGIIFFIQFLAFIIGGFIGEFCDKIDNCFCLQKYLFFLVLLLKLLHPLLRNNTLQSNAFPTIQNSFPFHDIKLTFRKIVVLQMRMKKGKICYDFGLSSPVLV